MAFWETDQWLGLIGLVFGIMLIAWLERKPSTWHLGLATFFFLFSIIHLLIPQKSAALWMTLALTATIGIASKVKYRYLSFNLLAGDLLYLVGSSIRGLLADHTRLIVTTTSAMIAVLAMGCVIAIAIEESVNPFEVRVQLLGAATLIYFAVLWSSGGSARFNFRVLTRDRAHLSAFVASWFKVGLSPRPVFIDIDQEALPLLAPTQEKRAQGEKEPSIILILHESTFDPRCLGLPLETRFENFFAPQDGLSGRLHVDVFGGGTIQTEFSVLTGLSSLSFGSDSGFVFHRMPGRIHHSLPSFLNGIGYDVSLISCSGPKLLNCERFYRSLGLRNISFADALQAPFDRARWEREHHDEQLYSHALDLLANRNDDKPFFLSVMTLMNHGSHGNRIFGAEHRAELRQRAAASTGNTDFGEYIVRLADSVDAYEAFRRGLRERLDGKPAIIVRFGDHQPSFTAPLSGKAPSDPALHKTFYAVEAVNCVLPLDVPSPPVLDVTYLSTLALLAAKVQLDPVFATRAALLRNDPAVYFDPTSVPKRRFHRALVEAGAVDLA
ncbi:sulfatase-like hydrolase/transferase [Mesorhizobium sp.]|uniref:sulfatase-like hydrolase/transferase n=1 Tax=Mesorhizobium sp. TaxID=1871066 RepID=UPI003BAAB29F